MLSEQLRSWYGMPEFQPSKVDDEILVIIDGIAALEAENKKLHNFIDKYGGTLAGVGMGSERIWNEYVRLKEALGD